MATFSLTVEDQSFDVNAETEDEARLKIQKYLKENPKPKETAIQTNAKIGRYKDKDTDSSIYDSDLKSDKKFIEASKILWSANHGRRKWGTQKPVDLSKLPRSGHARRLAMQKTEFSDEMAANYGLDQMGWFNWNLPKMSVDAFNLQYLNPREKEAFLYMMESTEDLGASWEGAGRLARGLFFDPTSYVGVATLGAAFFAKETAKATTRAGAKAYLYKALKTGMIGGFEGGLYSYTDDSIRQTVKNKVTGEEFDSARSLEATAKGFGAGFFLAGGLDLGIGKLQRMMKNKSSDEIVEEVNSDTTPDAKPVSKEALDEASIIDETPLEFKTKIDNVIETVKRVLPEGKIASLVDDVQNRAELSEFVTEVTEVIERLEVTDSEDLAKVFHSAQLSEPQLQVLQKSLQNASGEIKVKIANLLDEANTNGVDKSPNSASNEVMEKLYELDSTVSMALSTFNASTARRLGMLQEGLVKGDLVDLTMDSLINGKDKLTPLEAQRRYVEAIKQAQINQQQSVELNALKVERDRLIEENDIQGVVNVNQKIEEKLVEINLEVGESKLGKTLGKNFNRVVKGYNEYAIGNVFSTKTIELNTLPSLAKTFYKPLLDAISRTDGISLDAARTAWRQYNAMWSAKNLAFKSAIAAFRYERSILTGDHARFLEETNILPKQILKVPVGGLIRFFPRMLLSTDAFFEQLLYRSHIIGESTRQALEDGKFVYKLGSKPKKIKLEGKEVEMTLDDYLNYANEKAIVKGYDSSPDVTDLLIEDGVARGYKGEQLAKWVMSEKKKNKDILKTATDKQGTDFVKDTLFKREFSGEGAMSGAAKWYEAQVNKYPILRLMGQMFFRTPVRVFEEGFRLTPGLNLPFIMKDLRGGAGVPNYRHARAVGEAYLSMAIASYVLTKFAETELTGTIDWDYKLKRQAEDAGGKPYSIKDNDGSLIPYRNLDPFSTPIKIMTNALEAMAKLNMEHRQGVKDPNDLYGEEGFLEEVEVQFNEFKDRFLIGMTSVFHAVHDANLWSGLQKFSDIGKDFASEGLDDKAFRYIADAFIRPAIPSMYYKIQQTGSFPIPFTGQQVEIGDGNLSLPDPRNLEQFFKFYTEPTSPIVNRQHTALGTTRKIKDKAEVFTLFSSQSVKESQGDLSDKQYKILQMLDRLGRAENTNFYMPFKGTIVGMDGKGIDLRTVYTTPDYKDSKGKPIPVTTIYNAVQEEVSKDKLLENLLFNYANRKNVKAGVSGISSRYTTRIKEILKRRRDFHLRRVLRRNNLYDLVLYSDRYKRKLKRGLDN